MLVVSDTSPVSSLIQVGRADLLKDPFGTVLIPAAVRDELTRFHAAIPDFSAVREIADRIRVDSLLLNLDLGEAEVIVLAVETHADHLLMDERRGRSLAAQTGIPVIGLLGVLLLAKQQGRIATVKDAIVELQTQAGFYVSESVEQRTLEAAGE